MTLVLPSRGGFAGRIGNTMSLAFVDGTIVSGTIELVVEAEAGEDGS